MFGWIGISAFLTSRSPPRGAET